MKNNEIEVLIRSKGGERRRRETKVAPLPRVPRVTRLMALAIKFQGMIDRGEVRDYADLARLGCVTRARLTQIMNLTLLAPDIQEALLGEGARGVTERDLREVAAVVDWGEQRRRWGNEALLTKLTVRTSETPTATRG